MLTARGPVDRRLDGDQGITLIELVVAMALTTIVGAMTLAFFTVSFRSSSTTTASAQDTASVRTALDTWSSVLRVADSPAVTGSNIGRFTSIMPNDVQFNANTSASGAGTNGSPCVGCARFANVPVELKAVADTSLTGCFQLVEVLGTGSTATTRYLASHVANQAVFQYRTASGAITADPLSVASVSMTVIAGCGPGSSTTHTFSSSVDITGTTT